MNEKNIKAVISLLIALMAFAVFLLFYNYQHDILTTQSYYPFMILTFIGMALLLTLLFLVNRKSSKSPKVSLQNKKSLSKSIKKKKK